MSTQALTHEQKLQALAHRFYQGSAWQPKVGDYYTTSRADLELYRVVNVEGGKIYTEYCTRPGELTEWDADTFTTHGFGPRRVHVPDFILASTIAQTAPQPDPSSALADVVAERRRQIAVEGWVPEHDDRYHYGELSAAAASYALDACGIQLGHDSSKNPPSTWPWHRDWWKPAGARRNLVKAAALILAEIERLDRAAARGGAGDE